MKGNESGEGAIPSGQDDRELKSADLDGDKDTKLDSSTTHNPAASRPTEPIASTTFRTDGAPIKSLAASDNIISGRA